MRHFKCKTAPGLGSLAALFLAFAATPLLAADTAPASQPDWLTMGVGLFGGLALFLFGMEQMADGLKAAAGDKMRYVLGKLFKALNARGKPVRGSRVLVVGLAYKPDVADPRESPAFEIIDGLVELGAEVRYHDPWIPEAPAMRTWPDLPPMQSVDLDRETVAGQDAVLIVTHHSGIDYRALAEHAPLIIDTRGTYRRRLPNVVRA